MPRSPRIRNVHHQGVSAKPYSYTSRTGTFVRIRVNSCDSITLSIEDADLLAGDILAITQPLLFAKSLKGLSK